MEIVVFKLGLVLAVIGAITFAASFQRDVVESKELALKTPVKWLQMSFIVLGVGLMIADY